MGEGTPVERGLAWARGHKIASGVTAVVALGILVSLAGGGDDPDTIAPVRTVAATHASTAAPSAAPAAATPDRRPGSADVYARIESSTDCGALQRDFDTAEANHQREVRAGPERRRFQEITLSYMTAADDRMREIGCYDR